MVKVGILLALCVFSVYASQEEDFLKRHHIPWRRVGLPPPEHIDARAARADTGYIQQKLDNFDPSNTQTWNMRVISNGQFWQQAGPIFIMIGAEWTIDPGWVQGGQMYEMAKQNGAWMYYTEHRFYGQSRPTSDLSVENLRYLTTPQALEDLAVFIRYLKNNNAAFANSKVIVFGGSYGGSMSTWMRLKYPELVDGAIASSAPLLAKADFYEYEEVVAKSLETAYPGCTNIIANAFSQMEQILASGGAARLQRDLNLCEPINVNDENDVSYMFQEAAATFSGLVQYAKGGDLVNACTQLQNGGSDDYTRFTNYIKAQRPYCAGNYRNFVEYFRNKNLQGDSRQWIYQTCNEYGYFQTSGSNNQPFGHRFPVKLNYNMCKDIFGIEFNENHIVTGTQHTNQNFGGLNPQMTRVVSVHGGVDPWHAIGLSHNLNNETPVYIVPTTSHCADLQTLSPYDSPQMKAAKEAEQYYVKQWVNS